MITRAFTLFAGCLLSLLLSAPAHSEETDLTGRWDFALDPLDRGREHQWHLPWGSERADDAGNHRDWDDVEVPHCFTIDKRYEGFIGTAWYRRAFHTDVDPSAHHIRLRFEGVFYKASVWLNGERLGSHEGGYTPFEFPVTDMLKPGRNFLVVRVDNRWSRRTIPGARMGDLPRDQVYPWLEYGGITRAVSLIQTGKVYVAKQKIEAEPDLDAGTAKIRVLTWFRNAGDKPEEVRVKWNVKEGQQALVESAGRISLAPESTVRVERVLALEKNQVRLWHFDRPNLYTVETALTAAGAAAGETHRERFGIREIRLENGRLFLNDEPIRVGGANRHADHPRYGSIPQPDMLREDLTLLKEGGMELARLSHNPTSSGLLDWCDENGMLLIAEPGNWQIPDPLLSDPEVRANFRHQFQSMIERDWNHPSIIGWSVGNEYRSWTQPGDAWTRDMIAFGRSLDSTRPFTFVALGGAANRKNETVHDSFRHCDFLCFNHYGSPEGLEENLDFLHGKYPEKAILLTEFGKRTEHHTEAERIQYFNRILDVVEPRPYVVGAAWWAFNDYRSRYPGTGLDGYRRWGLVNERRDPRELYFSVQERFCPLRFKLSESSLTIRNSASFPAYSVSGYRIVFSTGETHALPDLEAGEGADIPLPRNADWCRIEKPGGFVCARWNLANSGGEFRNDDH